MIIKDKLIVVLDLDDTLYNEIDFLKSAYKAISNLLSKHTDLSSERIFQDMMQFYSDGENAFQSIITSTQVKGITIKDLLLLYRQHSPDISLSVDNKEALQYLKAHTHKIGLVTDGRSVQQRSKIVALELEDYFDDIIISEEFGSEKPNPNNFKYYNDKYGQGQYIYVGDNVKKDFIAPNALGWHSVCLLDNGKNIHTQHINLTAAQTPKYKIKTLIELKQILNQIIK
ncbi:HAD family hydrolase [Formosa algae]|uniref:HAD family hydrolase n=1 Tax=Formosa algae TaxID=225843 RepID=UPI000CCEA342|nr:HAD family hydrolase [Formosa algae]PNW26356.1 hypothetical protein BKP44_17310 [Formosa algae]